MKGDSIKNAGECLEIFIRSLPENSYFNIIRFGYSFTRLFNKSTSYNSQTRSKGISLAKSLSADLGGTNLLEPLSDLFSIKPIFDHRIVFILTDGEVTNREIVIDLVRNNSDKNQCFTIGFGRGCDGGLVEGIAEASRGKSDFVQEGDSISEKVIPQLQSAFCGSIQNIGIYCQNNDSFEIVPFPIPFVSYEKSILLFLHNKKNDKNTFNKGLLVTGESSYEPVDFYINNVTQLDDHDHEEDQFGCSKGLNIGKTIEPLSSFELLKLYEQKRNVSQKEEEMAVEISISSGVLCKYTSYVGMIESKEKASNQNNKKQYVIIDGKQYNVLNVTKAKTGKHGHGKTSFVLQDVTTGESIQKVVPSSQNLEIFTNKDDDSVQRNNGFDFISLLDYQNFEGYWENHQEINRIAGINVDHIEKLKVSNKQLEDKCIATLVAIATLHTLAKDSINSWKIIEEKGLLWLKKLISDEIIDELLFEIEQLIQNQNKH